MEKYYQSSELSDMDIVFITRQGQGRKDGAAKRRRQDDAELARFPAHKLALSSNSSVMENEISAGATRVKLVLDGPEYLPAAEAMIATMYGLPDALQQLDQPSVLRLALLANKYDAPKGLSTAVQQLSAQPLAEAVMDLMWQLPGGWEQPFWPLLHQIIKHKLDSTDSNKATAVTDLLLFVCDRDLEAVWTDSSSIRRDMLLQLPADALAAFLKSSELRVVSEDTVLYTVAQYCEALSTARPPVSKAALEEQRTTLLGAVRFPQLTPSCLFFITPEFPWIDQQQCRLAGFMQKRALSSFSVERMRGTTEWLSGPRSVSPKQQHTFQFTISLELVQDACEELMQKEPGNGSSLRFFTAKCSNGHSFGGRQWVLKVSAERKQEGVTLGLMLSPKFLCKATSHPWNQTGLVFTCGPHGESCTDSDYCHTVAGASSFIGPLTDAEDWRQPAWAHNGVVTIDVTVPASCCL